MLFFRFVLLFLACWTFALSGFTQRITTNNARSVGLGNTAVVLSDSWSVVNNPAGLAKVTHGSQLLLSYHNQYINLGIHDGIIGVLLPIKHFTPAVSISFFGDELLSENRISLAAGHQIGMAQLGLRLNYHQVQVQGYGSTQAVSLDMGGIFELSNHVLLGIAITNLTQSKFSTEGLSRVPSSVALGISYLPNKNLILNVQVDKTLKEAMDMRFGLEYVITPIFTFRTGLSAQQPAAYLGIGLDLSPFLIDLASQYQNSLGFSGGFSVGIQILKNK